LKNDEILVTQLSLPLTSHVTSVVILDWTCMESPSRPWHVCSSFSACPRLSVSTAQFVKWHQNVSASSVL
jgi:hypothetical protein